jgi:hypothetical protein
MCLLLVVPAGPWIDGEVSPAAEHVGPTRLIERGPGAIPPR